MHLLGADPDLRTEPELEPVREPRRRVHVNCSRVDLVQELLGIRVVLSHDRVRVPGPVLVDMLDRFIDRVHHLHCDDVVQVLRPPILLGCLDSVRDDFKDSLVPTDFDVLLSQFLHDQRKHLGGDILVD